MKKNLAVNYLLMCASWCLYLSHYLILSVIVSILACVLIVVKLRTFNYLRSLLVFFLTYGTLFFLFKFTSLNNFYPVFEKFILFITMNVSLSNEMIKKATGNLYLIYAVLMMTLLLFMTIAIILPDEWYSIFTKTNIYALIGFIFVPNCTTLTLSLISKEMKLA